MTPEDLKAKAEELKKCNPRCVVDQECHHNFILHGCTLTTESIERALRDVWNEAIEEAMNKCIATYTINDAITKNIIEQVEHVKYRIESLKLPEEGEK